jgi:sigma-B regulation protein RsbU (phosphoserine phosphatase)
MEGLDEDWIYTDAEKRFANYTTLPPGRYVFRVKGSNNDGVWNEIGTAVTVIITPSYLQSWWFRALVLVSIVGFAYAWYKRRLKNIRMKIELQTAHNAQMAIMPQTDPEIDGFDISGTCIPANEVGGDFFDYMWLDCEKKKYGIAIGDVSGKSMQAAMIAVMSSGMLCTNANGTTSTKEIITRLNRSIYSKTSERMFTTLCLVSVDTNTGELTYTVAGINEPFLKSNGAVVNLEAPGSCLPLGILKENRYEERTLKLEPDDVLVLFTDGIPDARNQSKDFYESYRLKKLLSSLDTTHLTAKEIKKRIIDDVTSFVGNTPQNDDMTVVVIKNVRQEIV